MSKSFRLGHAFPASAGFTGSSGKVAAIGPYTRRTPRRAPPAAAALNRGLFARATAPMPGPPKPKPKLAAPMVDPGSALQRAGSRKTSQRDVIAGGKDPFLPGYKRGGAAKKC